MKHYFRITGYYPKEDICFIIDSNGKFEKLWQFSAFIISKGCKVLEVSTEEKIVNINIDKSQEDKDHVILRACSEGKPKYIENGFDKVIEVKNKRYISKQ